jgi:hypothetical protein
MVMRGAGMGMARKASGFLHSSVPGRTDKIGLNIRNGSYVVPADVVAGHGQGNSLAGASALDKLFKSGPYGSSLGRVSAGSPAKGVSMPSMTKLSYLRPNQQNVRASNDVRFGHRASGGPSHVPVMAAGGEFVIGPEDVLKVGKGNAERGFRILDQFVLNSRAKQIKQLKGLKPPRKD